MNLRVEIKKIQHINELSLELNLAANKLTCIVGKNGIGKTTLIRAIRNLSQSDTFIRTAAAGIFDAESSISYKLDNQVIQFVFDRGIGSLNCKEKIPTYARELCAVELPMPHGDRFNFFQTVSDADRDIRRSILLGEYEHPSELIEFLSRIYSSDKFQRLVEIKIRNHSYYCILLDGNRYVREDYFSSGEYFLINLYRTIKSGAKLIVVDELDLSLDAAAQVHLLRMLRGFCGQYSCNILFTTHSLAMMRTLNPDELLYMDRNENRTELVPASYSYIKTLLFGFSGWDRYILTEDEVLHDFIEFIIRRYCKNVFYRYKIIYVGGGSQVADLLRRNESEKFLSDADEVIAILDGDQKGKSSACHPMIYFLPIESVEKALFGYYSEVDFPYKLATGKGFNGAKDLFNSLLRDGVPASKIYLYLCDRNDQSITELAVTLNNFLSISTNAELLGDGRRRSTTIALKPQA